MYIYICIAVVQVIRPHNVKPQRELDFSKVYIISLENHEPPEGVVVLRLRPRALRSFVFQLISACVSYALTKANEFRALFF